MNEESQRLRQDWIRNKAYSLWCFRESLGIKNEPINNWLDAEYDYDNFYAPHLKLFKEEGVL